MDFHKNVLDPKITAQMNEQILKTAAISTTRSPSPKSRAELQKKLKIKMQNKEEMEILKSQPLFLDKQGIPTRIQKNLIKDNLQKRIKLKMMQKGEVIPQFQVPGESKREGFHGYRPISPSPFPLYAAPYQQPATIFAYNPAMGMAYAGYGAPYHPQHLQVPQPIRWAQPMPQFITGQGYQQSFLSTASSPEQFLRTSPTAFYYPEQPMQVVPEGQQHQIPNNITPASMKGTPMMTEQLSITPPPALNLSFNPSTSPLKPLLSPNGSNQLFGLDTQQINALFPNGILSPSSLTSQLNADFPVSNQHADGNST